MRSTSTTHLKPMWLWSIFILLLPTAISASVADLFEHEQQTQLLMDIEAAMANAQAKHGKIPQWAAKEITDKARAELVSAQELRLEHDKVRHRMVALLNVWSRKLENGAEKYLHFGATTVDIYDTLLVLQLLSATEQFITQQRAIEIKLIALTEEHKSTPMIGRTLGQHALPITFGKMISGWLAENRRHIERMKQVRADLRQSAILKGAVGNYLGLGKDAIAVEQDYAIFLNLDTPYPDDWHASRDVFADYALTLAKISKSYGRWGQTIFLMQSNDLGELLEQRPATAVSSSSMPHKNNPSRSEALIHYSRLIPGLANVVLDDMVNFFERDNTSRPNQTIADLSRQAELMMKDTTTLIQRLKIKPAAMLENLDRTGGLITAQRVLQALIPKLGKDLASEKIYSLAKVAYESKRSFATVLASDETIAEHLTKEDIIRLTDSSTYLGLDTQQIAAVIKHVQNLRETDPQLNNE